MLRLGALTIVAALVVGIVSGGSLASCARPLKAVSIGMAPLESSALRYIAESQGFFRQNGLDVTLRGYDTGAASYNGMLKGEVDIATPAEYPLVGGAFRGDPVRAFTSIDKVEYFFLVARKDAGIERMADLKGKKIGVTRQTIAEFYLARLIQLNGMDIQDVTIVNVSVPDAEAAITSGQVDAIISRPPPVLGIRERLGDNAVIWPAQSSQSLFAILVSRRDWLEKHSDTVLRLLKALRQAEQYAAREPARAKETVQDKLGLDAAYVETIWPQNQFSLSLDQSLVAAMEDQARWMMANGLTTAERVPDFLDYIYENGLNAVKPRSVNIAR